MKTQYVDLVKNPHHLPVGWKRGQPLNFGLIQPFGDPPKEPHYLVMLDFTNIPHFEPVHGHESFFKVHRIPAQREALNKWIHWFAGDVQ